MDQAKSEEEEIQTLTIDLNYLDPALRVSSQAITKSTSKKPKSISNRKGLPKDFDPEVDVAGKYQPALLIVDGFSPGALKNIFTISGKELSVFSATEDSISLVSKSQLTVDPSKPYNNFMLHFESTIRLLYIFRGVKDSIVLWLDKASGRIKREETVNTLLIDRFWSYNLYKTSNIRYLDYTGSQAVAHYAELDGNVKWGRNAYFFRMNRSSLTPWMALGVVGDPGKRYRMKAGLLSRDDEEEDGNEEGEEEWSSSSYGDMIPVAHVFPYSKCLSLMMIATNELVTFKLLNLNTKQLVRSARYSRVQFFSPKILHKHLNLGDFDILLGHRRDPVQTAARFIEIESVIEDL